MSRDGQGLTPVVLETRCSHTGNLATWTKGGSADSEEPGTGVTGCNHDGPRHREVVPEVGPSTPDVGTKFASPGSALPQPEEVSLAPELPPRVLVAEDNHDLLQIFARQLTLLGLEVVGVSNGLDAVERALATYQAGNPFDLVLMDFGDADRRWIRGDSPDPRWWFQRSDPGSQRTLGRRLPPG